MTNPPPQGERVPAARQAKRRQVALPGAQQKQRRVGVLLFGLVLVIGSGFGFWFILQSIDQRGEYLMATRTIERWNVARAEDFAVVEANVGMASALTGDQLGAVQGKWATGRIPAGTIITAGLFETPPLSAESEAERVLIQVGLPAADAPFGTLNTGDTVALLGIESSGPEGQGGDLRLIGVLQLEFVQGDQIYYVVTPEEALQIKSSVDRYTQASDRTMLKLGLNLSIEDLVDALERQAAGGSSTAADASAEAASGSEPVEDQ